MSFSPTPDIEDMESLPLILTPRLVPVVEISPYRYPNHLPSPEHPATTEQWHEYWKASLQASGFPPLEAILPGSYFVPTKDLLSNECLDLLILRELEDVELEEGDLPFAFDGGYVLYDGESIAALPQCCGSLRDLADWREAAGKEELHNGFWIGAGHPGLGVKIDGDFLIFSSDGPEEEHIKPFRCRQDQLRQQVTSAQEDVEAFRRRLLLRAQEIAGRFSPLVCDALVGKYVKEHEEGW